MEMLNPHFQSRTRLALTLAHGVGITLIQYSFPISSHATSLSGVNQRLVRGVVFNVKRPGIVLDHTSICHTQARAVAKVDFSSIVGDRGVIDNLTSELVAFGDEKPKFWLDANPHVVKRGHLKSVKSVASKRLRIRIHPTYRGNRSNLSSVVDLCQTQKISFIGNIKIRASSDLVRAKFTSRGGLLDGRKALLDRHIEGTCLPNGRKLLINLFQPPLWIVRNVTYFLHFLSFPGEPVDSCPN